jgi:hypothetical protein
MLETALGIIATATFGTIAWAFQASSRLTKVETRQTDLPELIETKFDVVTERFDSIAQRLSRIERAMNGKLTRHD